MQINVTPLEVALIQTAMSNLDMTMSNKQLREMHKRLHQLYGVITTSANMTHHLNKLAGASVEETKRLATELHTFLVNVLTNPAFLDEMPSVDHEPAHNRPARHDNHPSSRSRKHEFAREPVSQATTVEELQAEIRRDANVSPRDQRGENVVYPQFGTKLKNRVVALRPGPGDGPSAA